MATDNTKIDFNYCIEQINRDISLEHNDQSIYLNSNDANIAFNKIETSLNLVTPVTSIKMTLSEIFDSFIFEYNPLISSLNDSNNFSLSIKLFKGASYSSISKTKPAGYFFFFFYTK